MDYYGVKSSEMQPDSMMQEGLSPKKIVSRSFFALFMLAVVANAVQVLIVLLVENFTPDILLTDWFEWALTAFSMIVVGFPVYYLIMRKVPDSPKGEVSSVKPLFFIAYFFICVAAMYLTNFFTQILVYAITIIKGEELFNPAADAILNGNFIISLIYASVIAPVYEELVFRKLLLNKLRRFGDVPAILMTGIAFGLFHFNLLQFFYATVLGFLFAYITIRTNTVIYSIILHMMINFISVAIAPIVTKVDIIGMMMIAGCILTAIIFGVVFFFLGLRRIRIDKSAPVMKISAYFLNLGTILFMLLSVALFVMATLA